ncbi:Eukaryotic translation initiation factor 6-2 [Platanthera guangdongensis]|uniref:Eukaryotic translation initiation factor 6-2 n=1 Tax=Platanthera guangdongensis TaxID=2320717 RepID=A0ABR2MZ03_9ASPA
MMKGSLTISTLMNCKVPPHTSFKELEELSALLQVPLVTGTVNGGRKTISGGMIVNDWTAFCGSATTDAELSVIESVFKLNKAQPSMIVDEMRKLRIDSYVILAIPKLIFPFLCPFVATFFLEGDDQELVDIFFGITPAGGPAKPAVAGRICFLRIASDPAVADGDYFGNLFPQQDFAKTGAIPFSSQFSRSSDLFRHDLATLIFFLNCFSSSSRTRIASDPAVADGDYFGNLFPQQENLDKESIDCSGRFASFYSMKAN